MNVSSASAATFTPLTLENGWTNAPFSTRDAAITKVGDIVYLRGAIATTGTNTEPFVIPTGYRPTSPVYVKVDMCDATNGRLVIARNGTVTVQAESDFSNAQCFTSLEGVSFAINQSGFVRMTLQNGWTNAPFSTRDAAAKTISGIVHLSGAIATSGSNAVAFTLPAADRPSSAVYVPVDMCNATNGRLEIATNGTVSVVAESDFSNAQCFTSLEGVNFAINQSGFTTLVLQNGWTEAPFSTRNAAAETISGIVFLSGAIASGTSSDPFTLPAVNRPSSEVYVPVDQCDATNGRLDIAKNGVTAIETESDDFSNAQCFTSLEGVEFSR